MADEDAPPPDDAVPALQQRERVAHVVDVVRVPGVAEPVGVGASAVLGEVGVRAEAVLDGCEAGDVWQGRGGVVGGGGGGGAAEQGLRPLEGGGGDGGIAPGAAVDVAGRFD